MSDKSVTEKAKQLLIKAIQDELDELEQDSGKKHYADDCGRPDVFLMSEAVLIEECENFDINPFED
jgi:hypothetical protein